MDPAQRAEPDPVRPRPVPAADPGHGHQPHVAHRGRARLRQGGDQPDPRRPRPAGAAAAAGAARPTTRSRPPSGSATRWWSSRTTPTTAAASRSTSRPTSRCAPAFEEAREHSRSVIVESFIAGDDHRMLVVNGELVAVSKRVPGHVVGDGEHTIAELVDEVNRDPRRGIGHEKVLTRLEFDHQAERLLAEKGYTRDTVPADGRGGLPALDRQPLDRRHRDRRHRRRAPRQRRDGGARGEGDRARRRRRGLPHARHHRVATRTSAAPSARSTRRPASACTWRPSEGKPRDVAGPVIDMLFPPGTPEPDPDRRDHRHQRQDDDRAHAGAHPQAGGPPRRPHHHRRRLHRRPAHRGGRHDRPGRDAHGAERSDRGRGGARDGARRPAPRRHGRTATATSARCSTCKSDHLGPQRHRHARASWPR